DISPEEYKKVIFDHFYLLIPDIPEKKAVRMMRRYLPWYTKGFRNSSLFRQEICKIEDRDELVRRILSFFPTGQKIPILSG
ncbi:MAG: hypothetical protein V1872_08730, partial [bacterium]